MMSASAPDDGRALTAVLRRAAEEAGRAPSVLNTQPWRWHVGDGGLELFADRTRQLRSIDPDGRLLVLSCGTALHHARVALAASGFDAAVQRFPDTNAPDLLARVRVREPREVRQDDVVAVGSMRQRRTDRRAFRDVPIAAGSLTALRKAAEGQGTMLHRVDGDQVTYLRAAARSAQAIETKDQCRVEELGFWTRRTEAAGDGLPPETVTAAASRTVPLRDFGLGERAALAPGRGDDRCAEYLVLATPTDDPAAWLRAGEATSAVWLTAIREGLAVSPMSESIEVPGARALLRSLLQDDGCPQLVLRVGTSLDLTPPPTSPRRPAGDVIDTEHRP